MELVANLIRKAHAQSRVNFRPTVKRRGAVAASSRSKIKKQLSSADMTADNRGSMVDGVGDELVYSFVLGVVAVVLSSHVMRRRFRNSGNIHPDSQANVQGARAHLEPGSDDQNSSSQEASSAEVEPRTYLTPTAPELIPEETIQNSNTGPTRGSRRYRQDDNCPICMGASRFAIETNCGHLFCGNCFVLYWQRGNWLGAVRCPICRTSVTLLLFCFTDAENTESSTEKRNIVNNIKAYNRRFSGEPRSIIEYLQDLPTLLRHFAGEFFSLSGIIRLFNARIYICIIAAVLYLVSPLDIIPEAVFGLLGLLDDVFVLLLFSVYLTIIYRGIVAERAWS